MTSIIDPSTIGKARVRKHVRTLTGKLLHDPAPMRWADANVVAGYQAEKDETGKEKWPIGDESTWKAGLRGVDTGGPTICPS